MDENENLEMEMETDATVTALVEDLRVAMQESDWEFMDEEEAKVRSNDLREKLDNLTIIVSAAGPTARNEAVEANAGDLISRVWKWPFSGESDSIVDERKWETLWEFVAIVREAALRTMNALTPGHSEIVNAIEAANMIVSVFKSSHPDLPDNIIIPESMIIEALKAMKNLCIKSESNRATLADTKRGVMTSLDFVVVDDSIFEPFCNLVKNVPLSSALVRNWCEALAAFILNDDKRVALNRAEERKRIITDKGGLISLIGFLSNFKDSSTLNRVIIALTMMASHKDSCDVIVSADVLKILGMILQKNTTQQRDRFVLNTIACIRSLCLSLNFSQKVENTYLVKTMLAALVRLKERTSFALETIVSAIAYVTIRSVTAVMQLLSEQGVDTILDIMKLYKENFFLTRGCCLVLENVATHGEELGTTSILEWDDGKVTELLKQVCQLHPPLVQNFINPLLRDFDKTPRLKTNDASILANEFITPAKTQVLTVNRMENIDWGE